jgi:hypothetical protein
MNNKLIGYSKTGANIGFFSEMTASRIPFSGQRTFLFEPWRVLSVFVHGYGHSIRYALSFYSIFKHLIVESNRSVTPGVTGALRLT